MISGLPIFATILAFALVVFVHEFGHYIVGRLCGIGAEVFSIGFGPKLFGFIDKNNTEWKICLLPLGGYVKFLTSTAQGAHTSSDSENIKKTKAEGKLWKTFENASLISRGLTVLAGPVANFLFAVAIFTFLSSQVGVFSNEPIIGSVVTIPGQKDTLKKGDKVISVDNQPIKKFTEIFELTNSQKKNNTVEFEILREKQLLNVSIPYFFQPVVVGVEMFSPAMEAGVQEGDVFLEANRKVLSSFSDLKNIINDSEGSQVSIKYWRDGKIETTFISPEMRPTETADGNIQEVMRIGIRGGSLFSPERVAPSIAEAIGNGFEMTWYVLKTSVIALARMIDNSISAKHLSGPIGVAKALSYSANEGLIPFLSLVAAVSAGLGLVNLFPIPILDGGHLILFFYEGLFRKPPSVNFMKYTTIIGLTILVVIMVFVTVNDIMR